MYLTPSKEAAGWDSMDERQNKKETKHTKHRKPKIENLRELC